MFNIFIIHCSCF